MNYVIIYSNEKHGVSVMSVPKNDNTMDEINSLQLTAKKLLTDKKFFIVSSQSLPTDNLPDFWTLNDQGDISIDEKAKAEYFKEKNKNIINLLINDADKEIEVIKRSIKYGLATDEQKKKLEDLEMYTVKLSLIDVSVNQLVLPERP